MIVNIVLTYAGGNVTYLNIYSDSDNYASPLATNIPKQTLLNGDYYLNNVPGDATIIRILAVGTCYTSIDIPITT